MGKYPFQQIASKWLKTQVMLKNKRLVPYIPTTTWFQRKHLFSLLEQHRLVYLKPDKGGGGVGVVRVEMPARGQYVVHYATVRKNVIGDNALLTFLTQRTRSGKQYILQRGIPLARIKGRPFDIRIVVQKPEAKWVVMGMVAKVAAKAKVVTNRAGGGMALSFADALSESFHASEEQIKNAQQQLTAIALETASALCERFTRLRVLGLDVGFDDSGCPWIFEVNTRPLFHLFQTVDHPRYRQIIDNQRKIIADERKRALSAYVHKRKQQRG